MPYNSALELLRQFDPSYGSDAPIYTPEGGWSYERFEQWLLKLEDFAVNSSVATRKASAKKTKKRQAKR